VTAQRVAAQRLSFDRVPVSYGNPGGDDELARDVAAGAEARTGLMRDYLRARTRFFDEVVTTVLGNGCPQVVVGAAGYDGRALRYALPGVRWFEIDHPATQQDKRARLRRLGIGCDHVTFVAADFARDWVADLLVSAGLDASRPALFLLEGVAAYLEIPVLRALLGQLRRVAADGSLLAVSAPVSEVSSKQQAARRVAFRAAATAAGEPPRPEREAGQVWTLLEETGWQAAEPPGVAQPGAAGLNRAAGFGIAAPASGPAAGKGQERNAATGQVPTCAAREESHGPAAAP
jgi:methyltransferase (TIGR00027 family)